MCPRVCALDSIGVHMAGDACRIGSLCIVARGAALNVAPRKLCMESSTAPDAERYKRCLSMGFRLEASLVDVTPRRMAGCAEGLLAVTRLAIRRLPFSRKAVRKLEIQIVDLRDPQALATIDCRYSRRVSRHQILPGHVNFQEIGAVVAIRARLLCMARRTIRRR